MKTEHFTVTGMSCAACSAHIEKALAKMPGIKLAQVNLLANSMDVTFDEDIASAQKISETVKKAGYGAVLKMENGAQPPQEKGENPIKAELFAMKRRLVFSFAFTIPLMYISMANMLGLPLPSFFIGVENAIVFALSQFLLALPVVIINHKYFSGGFSALLRRAPNMDSLIAIGCTAALAYGVFALYRIGYGLGHGDMGLAAHYLHDLYFESAATILSLISLGKTMETVSKGRTGEAISALLSLAPKTALVLKDGLEMEVPIAQVAMGDVLAVKPGASVPVDGVLLSGHGLLDESALTGESMPQERQKGENVTGATVNTSGYFTMRATRVGKDTSLAQIVALVEEAGASKAPIAKLADKVSGVFVPLVILFAILCFAVWMFLGQGVEFALARAVTVLVISCPCALGLATPVAIMVGTGRGAKNGILYRNARALQTLSKVDTFVLDKTGTVTQGKPQLTDIVAIGMDENSLLQLAAGLEAKSEHPVAKAILDEAKKRGLLPANAKDFDSVSGLGIKATVEEKPCFAGNARFMQSQGIELAPLKDAANALAAQGKTPLYFAQNALLLGLVAVADLPKPSSAAAIAAMRQRGIKTIMLTGDTAETAKAVAKMVGLDKTIAEVLPKDKDKTVQELMEKGHVVAMIGDGINDAPALARADVGIAIGTGTDVAIESADVVLMRSDLGDAVTARDLSKAVLRNIKQNLFWAFFYNIIGIPIAAGLFYPNFMLDPMFGAAAMSLSSVFVVTNALRLNFFSPKAMPALQNGHTQKATALPVAKNTVIDEREKKKMEKVLLVEGMSCGHCSARVEKALNALPGVSAKVNLQEKTATLTMAQPLADDVLIAAVKDAGYECTTA